MSTTEGSSSGWQTIPGKKGKKKTYHHNRLLGEKGDLHGKIRCGGERRNSFGLSKSVTPLIPPNPKLNREDAELAERIRSHFHDLFKSGPAQYENPIVENGLKELDFASRSIIGKYPHLGEFLAEDPR